MKQADAAVVVVDGSCVLCEGGWRIDAEINRPGNCRALVFAEPLVRRQ